MSDLTVAVDIGGTFTDIALLDPARRKTWRAKTPSNPADPSTAFMTGLELVMADAGVAPGAIGRVLHGTTVATNMILEGRGARAALVTTAGFRHVLEIGRQDIPRRANLYAWIKPKRPVPPSRVFEVVERVGPGGDILAPLDETSVLEAIESCRRAEVEAVAICLLHSFANPAHERRVEKMFRDALPGVAVTASTDVLPVVREYERSLAAVMNAIVMPGVGTYVRRLEQRLADAGVSAPLLLMQSNGGVAGAKTIFRAPALTALSGPAAGVVGARDVAAACGIENIITVDIGGTSADICLIHEGKIGLTQQGRIGEWPLPLPMVDMVTIGAGGGSLARVRDAALRVGPESAGAVPGPACYGRGGTMATVTDAHVVLGHLPARLLGGRMALDVGCAEAAVADSLAAPLGMSLHDAARGILAIADSNMVGAIRVVSVERGHDPRDFTLVAFGGAGPLHGCALAELLGMTRVLIPPAPGVLCAEGLLAAQLKSEFSRTIPRAGRVDAEVAARIFGDLEGEAAAWFAQERVPATDRATAKVGLLRYQGQGNELAVAWPEDGSDVEAAFSRAHETLYGFTLPAPIELVTVRVEATGKFQPPPAATIAAGTGVRLARTTTVHFASGSTEAALIDRSELGAGDRVAGPAIITQLDATTVVRPGWTCAVQPSGALVISS